MREPFLAAVLDGEKSDGKSVLVVQCGSHKHAVSVHVLIRHLFFRHDGLILYLCWPSPTVGLRSSVSGPINVPSISRMSASF